VKYPQPVYQIARGIKLYEHHNTNSWQMMYGLKYAGDPQEHITRTAAHHITQEFVQHVMAHHQIETRETPQGLETRFAAVALSWPELLELLYRAFAEGHTEGMRRTNQINQWIDKHQATQDA